MAKHSAWRRDQSQDPYFQKAKQMGLRSRAAFKLVQMHEKYRLFKSGDIAIDLGAAPGGWSQVLRPWLGPKGALLAVDCEPMAALPQVDIITGDVTEEATMAQIGDWLMTHGQADWLLSDMAPKLSGIKEADLARTLELNTLCLHLGLKWLKLGGGLVAKFFEGPDAKAFATEVRCHFASVMIVKPSASRQESREQYLVALDRL